MKKIIFYLLAACLSLTFNVFTSNATITETPTPIIVSKSVESVDSKALLLRLDEINAMDKSNLSRIEKKTLRKEVRSIDKSLRQGGGGIYISVGAIIIILLLLVILL